MGRAEEGVEGNLGRLRETHQRQHRIRTAQGWVSQELYPSYELRIARNFVGKPGNFGV
jgi:hypothetical protein